MILDKGNLNDCKILQRFFYYFIYNYPVSQILLERYLSTIASILN